MFMEGNQFSNTVFQKVPGPLYTPAPTPLANSDRSLTKKRLEFSFTALHEDDMTLPWHWWDCLSPDSDRGWRPEKVFTAGFSWDE